MAFVERHPSPSVSLHLHLAASLRQHLHIRGQNLFIVSAPIFRCTRRSTNAIWPLIFAYTCVYAGRCLRLFVYFTVSTVAYTREEVSDCERRAHVLSYSALVERHPAASHRLQLRMRGKTASLYLDLRIRRETSPTVLSAAFVERRLDVSHRLNLRIRRPTASLCLHLRIRREISLTVSAPMFCRARRSLNAIWTLVFVYTCVYAGRHL